MIVNYLNVLNVSANPTKTDSKLVVDANAVLSRAISFEQLQVIPRRIPKVIQALCCMNHF